jgi:hypothetical protein
VYLEPEAPENLLEFCGLVDLEDHRLIPESATVGCLYAVELRSGPSQFSA